MEGVYSKAYVEVLEILKYIPAKEYLKIPQEEILELERYKDNNYEFNYDVNIPFEDQTILKETKVILITLFNKYFLSNVQKAKLKRILNYNDTVVNEKKSEKYKYDDIFEKNSSNDIKNIKNNNINNSGLLMTECKDTFINKIINKIKKIFYKK